MKLFSIFDNCLYAIQYTGEPLNEFKRIFQQWNDTEYLLDFFEKNKKDLQNGNWETSTVDKAVEKTISDAFDLMQAFLDISKQDLKDQYDSLDLMFESLHNLYNETTQLNKRKAKQKWLRIYALKTEDNAFIVTGGTIKLTNSMIERRHTSQELKKLESVRKYLLHINIISADDIIENVEL